MSYAPRARRPLTPLLELRRMAGSAVRRRRGAGRGPALCCTTLVLAAATVLPGCAAWRTAADVPPLDEELLSGGTLFMDIALPEPPTIDIVAVTDEMRGYLREHVPTKRSREDRFRLLLQHLSRDGYFESGYQADITHTAEETFREKRGNCLSYTNMFVGMARAAGLDARYQLVSVPPRWDADAGYLIRYKHVNVLVKDLRLEDAPVQDITVDFNSVHPDPEYTRREISDSYATALYYANRSVGFLRADDLIGAFSYLRKAIELAPKNSDFWVNLGAVYAAGGDYELATRAYEHALALNARGRAALAGLARSHRHLGNHDIAEYYAERVRSWRERNPYYHFAVAQSEYEKADYEQALDAINKAIRLRRRSGQFFFLKALAEEKLGETEAARESFRRAQRLGNYRDLKVRYKSLAAASG